MEKPGFSARLTKEVSVGGLCWILSLKFFVGQAAAQLSWTGAPYNLVALDAITHYFDAHPLI